MSNHTLLDALNDKNITIPVLASRRGLGLIEESQKFINENRLRLEALHGQIRKAFGPFSEIGSRMFLGMTIVVAQSRPDLAAAFEPAATCFADVGWIRSEAVGLVSLGSGYYTPAIEFLEQAERGDLQSICAIASQEVGHNADKVMVGHLVALTVLLRALKEGQVPAPTTVPT